MGARVKLPKIGSLCRFTWLDAVGYIGVDADEPRPASCITVGWLKSVEKDYILVATSLYTDGSGDFTVLPIGILTAVHKVEENER